MPGARTESDGARAAIARAEAPVAETVLMCRDCTRRLGPEGQVIRQALTRALETSRWGRVRLRKTGCFSLCPRRGQVLAAIPRGGERRLLVVTPGMPVEPALDYLLRARPALRDEAPVD